MLRSMRLQRVRHDLVTEQQQRPGGGRARAKETVERDSCVRYAPERVPLGGGSTARVEPVSPEVADDETKNPVKKEDLSSLPICCNDYGALHTIGAQ